MNPEIVVIGYTNIDVNVTIHSTTTSPGGAAYFVALAASRILKPIGLVTRIGKDFDPAFLLKHVLSEGVHIIDDKPTAKSTQIYHSLTDLTQRSITLDWGVAPDLNPDDIPAEWIQQAKYIHIGTMPPKQQQVFTEYLKTVPTQAKISIDTDIAFLNDEENIKIITSNSAACDMVFANRREYQLLKPVLDDAKEAIIKQDSDGAYYMQHGKIMESVTTDKVKAVDVTGAGDIFAGTFIGCSALGKSTGECLQKAAQVATLAVAKDGIQHLFD